MARTSWPPSSPAAPTSSCGRRRERHARALPSDVLARRDRDPLIDGAFGERGPSAAWLRLRRQLVAGEDASPLQRLAAAADFGNGISSTLSWDDYVFINPDLTVYVEREPSGEWICLQARTRIAPGGIGVSESVLYDERGRVGRATQALLVTRR